MQGGLACSRSQHLWASSCRLEEPGPAWAAQDWHSAGFPRDCPCQCPHTAQGWRPLGLLTVLGDTEGCVQGGPLGVTLLDRPLLTMGLSFLI